MSMSLMEAVAGMLSTDERGVKKGDWDEAEWVKSAVSSEREDEEEVMGGESPTLRRFLDSGPQLSDARIALSASSAVYIRRAIAPSERRILSVCQSDGPSYLGIGDDSGPSSYIDKSATRCVRNGCEMCPR